MYICTYIKWLRNPLFANTWRIFFRWRVTATCYAILKHNQVPLKSNKWLIILLILLYFILEMKMSNSSKSTFCVCITVKICETWQQRRRTRSFAITGKDLLGQQKNKKKKIWKVSYTTHLWKLVKLLMENVIDNNNWSICRKICLQNAHNEITDIASHNLLMYRQMGSWLDSFKRRRFLAKFNETENCPEDGKN